ncbi:MAG: hydrogenase nickel incorporation protein HypB [Anaerolineaceae bacterium]|nr:hydrogenase nickel incorporation protein HypB [Anaerolineaceae bacterium]
MANTRIQIVKNILSANDRSAEENLEFFNARNILAVNIMASPGAGKTSVILQTIKALSPDTRIAVIEGDTAPVTIDSEKVSNLGIPVTQINTGGNCHLEAMMVRKGLQHLELDHIELLIIENVGNLICPASFKLGAHINLVIASIPEGDDKPYKYPGIYRGIDCLILNKIDLLPYVDFNQEYFRKGIEALNPSIPIFPVSCKTLEGFDAWTSWLRSRMPGK